MSNNPFRAGIDDECCVKSETTAVHTSPKRQRGRDKSKSDTIGMGGRDVGNSSNPRNLVLLPSGCGVPSKGAPKSHLTNRLTTGRSVVIPQASSAFGQSKRKGVFEAGGSENAGCVTEPRNKLSSWSMDIQTGSFGR